MPDLSKMTDWDKLKGMLEKSADEGKEHKIDAKAFLEHLRSRIKGQDAILEDVSKLLHLQMAKKHLDPPHRQPSVPWSHGDREDGTGQGDHGVSLRRRERP